MFKKADSVLCFRSLFVGALPDVRLVPNVPERETVPVALEDGFTSRPCGVNYLASILLKVETSGSQHIPDEMVIYFSPCYCWFSGAAGNKAG
jgi:hypothetical protein